MDTNRQQSSHSELLIDNRHRVLLVKGIQTSILEESHIYITVVFFGSNPPYLSLSYSSLLPRCNPVEDLLSQLLHKGSLHEDKPIQLQERSILHTMLEFTMTDLGGGGGGGYGNTLI